MNNTETLAPFDSTRTSTNNEPRSEQRGARVDLMDQCSRLIQRPGTTSHQPYRHLTHQPGHNLDLGLHDQDLASAVLTGRRLGHQPGLRPDHRCSPIRLAPWTRPRRRPSSQPSSAPTSAPLLAGPPSLEQPGTITPPARDDPRAAARGDRRSGRSSLSSEGDRPS